MAAVWMRGGAVVISAAAFGWVVVQAQGGCESEASPAEPEAPVRAPAEEPEPEPQMKADAETKAGAEVKADAQPETKADAQPKPKPGPKSNRGNSNAGVKDKAFFPASKSGMVGGFGDDEAEELGAIGHGSPSQRANPAPSGD